MKNGANVESETETGYRPIHVAAHFGNLSMIRFLLKHSATIDVKSNQNYTPLHQAAQQGHAHIVSALLEGNASHKARTNVSNNISLHFPPTVHIRICFVIVEHY